MKFFGNTVALLAVAGILAMHWMYVPSTSVSDGAGHAMMFVALAGALAFRGRYELPDVQGRQILWIGSTVAIVGELSQALLPHRSAESKDLAIDLAIILLFAFLAAHEAFTSSGTRRPQ